MDCNYQYKLNGIYIYNKRLNSIKLMNSNCNSMAKICLSQGGSLQELTLNNNLVIGSLDPLKYQITFASAILFPFANRINQGLYKYSQRDYKLECNEKQNNNAIHGLIFNKQFNIKNKREI